MVYVTLQQGVYVTEDELLAFAKSNFNEAPALPRRLFILEHLPKTAVGKIYKPALRQDCAPRHFQQLLQGEPIAALTVRDEVSRRQVLSIEVTAAEAGICRETRQRIAAAFTGYLLTLEWAACLPTESKAAS